MSDGLFLRPMNITDTAGVYHMSSKALTETAEEREEIGRRSVEEVERRKERYRHFLEHDPEGAWVAADGDRVVGVALALAREGVWVLSLFAVDEEYRGAGVGRALLDRVLGYAEGCERGAILASSTHPAAMRSYARSGFDLLPSLVASGKVRRASLPAGLKVREGTEDDLQLAAEVDRLLRGAAHGPDLEFVLQTGCQLLVVERPAGRGYAVVWEGSPVIIAATTPDIAADLLWFSLTESSGAEVEVRWITGAQNWAVPVVLDAGLSLSPSGPICVRGELGPLTPYLPSGPFL
ncbi:MAG: GNAT family N-acetyltransferase [Actinomycetota bacterium]|nr:GNAT family N-acetyltransferase [Actinomycetota bacterium]